MSRLRLSYNNLSELCKSLSEPEVNTLKDKIPVECFKDISQPIDFLIVLHNLENHNPNAFDSSLQLVRPDLVDTARLFPWLSRKGSDVSRDSRQTSMKDFVELLDDNLSPQDWKKLLRINKLSIPNPEFAKVSRLFLRMKIIAKDLQKLKDAFEILRRKDLISKVKPYMELFSGMDDWDFGDNFLFEISKHLRLGRSKEQREDIQLALRKLTDSLTEKDIQILKCAIDAPDGIFMNIFTPLDFLSEIQGWKRHDPYYFDSALKLLRPDLVETARKIPWLSRESSGSEGIQRAPPSMENFVELLKTEIPSQDWTNLFLSYDQNVKNLNFVKTCEFCIEKKIIRRDLSELKRQFQIFKRDNLVLRLEPYVQLFSELKDDEFENEFIYEVKKANCETRERKSILCLNVDIVAEKSFLY